MINKPNYLFQCYYLKYKSEKGEKLQIKFGSWIVDGNQLFDNEMKIFAWGERIAKAAGISKTGVYLFSVFVYLQEGDSLKVSGTKEIKRTN